MQEFFSAHADSIVEWSILPDLRRDEDDQEQYYHYIDIDRYGKYPFSDLPRDLEEAQAKYGADSVRKNGIVPWRIVDLLGKLTEAMKAKNTNDIIHYAADLGHYVADVHVPLHTTENYDGQLSDQKGVHRRFETDLPERYGKDYSLAAQGPEYIVEPLAYVFELVLETYLFVDSVLYADGKVKEGIPEGELYQIVRRSGRNEYHYSSLYYERYHAILQGLPERRMRAAVYRLASFWYTAWVNAGKLKLPLR
ncbi:MAG: S1/P1 Nuclease [Bacteroidota bacterium]